MTGRANAPLLTVTLAVIVTQVVIVITTVTVTAVPTANRARPDLLPIDCGRRQVLAGQQTRPLVVGDGNTTAAYGRYPWQARVEVLRRGRHRHQCGGFIISQWYVLTAAHCVINEPLSGLVVRVGDHKFSQREHAEQGFAVTSTIPHHRYGGNGDISNDVALLRLRGRPGGGGGVQFGPFVAPACLPAANVDHEPSVPCEVSGWGRTADGGPLSDVLRGVTVPLVSDTYCASPEVYPHKFKPGIMLCAGSTDRLTSNVADACEGDSGGPLACYDEDSARFVVNGIVASGDSLGCGGRPGLYTKVSAYIDWLLRRLQLDHHEQEGTTELRGGTTEAGQPLCGTVTFPPPPTWSGDYVDSSRHFPWMASVRYANDSHRCTAAIISDRWLVTSSVCGETTESLSVRLGDVHPPGSADETSSPVNINIAQLLRNPNAGKTPNIGGIYLLKTETQIPFSSIIRPVCLWDRSTSSSFQENNTLILSGFSGIGVEVSPSNFSVQPGRLRWSRVRVAGVDECQAIYSTLPSRLFPFRENAFCTKYLNGTGRLNCRDDWGDSGSLLMEIINVGDVLRWHAVGIRLAGPGCTRHTILPDASVALADLAPWILDMTGLAARPPPPPVPRPSLSTDDETKACGRCLPLEECDPLLQRVAVEGNHVLESLLCGFNAPATALFCCSQLGFESVPGCGVTQFSVPELASAGYSTHATDFPWIAAVYTNRMKRFFQGGVIISDRWILTMYPGFLDTGFVVRVGDVNLMSNSDDSIMSPPFDVGIEEVVLHPEHVNSQHGTWMGQFMLLKTTHKLPLSSTVRPICLPFGVHASDLIADKKLIFTGWGSPFFDVKNLLQNKWAKIKVVNLIDCKKNYSRVRSRHQRFGADSFCTKAVTSGFQREACAVNQGDHGCPFMEVIKEGNKRRWFLVGMASWGIGCGSEKFSDVNLALTPAASSWILSAIAKG